MHTLWFSLVVAVIVAVAPAYAQVGASTPTLQDAINFVVTNAGDCKGQYGAPLWVPPHNWRSRTAVSASSDLLVTSTLAPLPPSSEGGSYSTERRFSVPLNALTTQASINGSTIRLTCDKPSCIAAKESTLVWRSDSSEPNHAATGVFKELAAQHYVEITTCGATDRVAKALEHAIRLSGGKAPKF